MEERRKLAEEERKKELERKYQAFLKEEAERRRIQLEETLRLADPDFDRDIYAGYVESILPYIEPEGRRFYRAFQG